jgi:hypothetical protein
MKKPFDLEDIEDCRIIIKAKGKNYSIIPKKKFDRDMCRNLRIVLGIHAFEMHDIVDTALEDIDKEKLKKKLNKQK